MRPRHCTPLGLRPAISPNVGNSGAEFLVVGVRVRAAPDKTKQEKNLNWIMVFRCVSVAYCIWLVTVFFFVCILYDLFLERRS